MCLSLPTSHHHTKSSHHDPEPEPHRPKPKYQDNRLADHPNPPTHFKCQQHHQPSHGEKEFGHHRSKIPNLHQHTHVPTCDGTQYALQDHSPKTTSVPVYIALQSKHRKNSSSGKRQPDRHRQENQTQIKADDCQKARIRADECQQAQFQAYESQQAHTKTNKPLLNGQGVPNRLLLPTAKQRILQQGRNPHPTTQKPRNGNKTIENRTPVLHNPDIKNNGQGTMPSIRELTEPRNRESMRHQRRPTCAFSTTSHVPGTTLG